MKITLNWLLDNEKRLLSFYPQSFIDLWKDIVDPSPLLFTHLDIDRTALIDKIGFWISADEYRWMRRHGLDLTWRGKARTTSYIELSRRIDSVLAEYNERLPVYEPK